MKKSILILALLGAFFFTATSVSAKGVIFYNTGEHVEVSKELPADATIDGEHVNLGVMYEQFSIFWVPIWNYGETKHVLINDKKDAYWDLDAELIESLETEFNIEIPEKPAIGFWNKIGGKIVVVIVILGLVFYQRRRKDDDATEIPTESPQTTDGQPNN
ncbi:MAG: hypothetical protein LBE91_08840 [Tannerella sp.]|jgi:hypothetical protein|nr:hypothetical protein [Tannerella sp.]